MNERRIITAVQKEGAKTWFEVFDFGCDASEIGTKVIGDGDTLFHQGDDEIDQDELDYQEEPDQEEGSDMDDLSSDMEVADDDTMQVDPNPPSAPLMRTLSLPPFNTATNAATNQMFPDMRLFPNMRVE